MLTYHTGREFATGERKNDEFVRRLNEVEASLGHPGAVALRAGAADHKGMAAGVELMLPAHLAQSRLDCGALKLNHFAALFAAHVLVLWITVVVLVIHTRPQLQAA